jgi:hypothetical protein
MATGYDAIDPASIPAGIPAPQYVGGYINGEWPSYQAMRARFPSAIPFSISADPLAANSLSAVCSDMEQGDYSPEQAADAAAAKITAGWVPATYCSFSDWHDAMEACTEIDILPSQVDWLIAAYPGIGPVLYPGSPGHQWVDRGSYDQWVIEDGWLPGRPIHPRPVPELNMQVTDPVSGGTWVLNPENGSIWAYAVEGSGTPPYLGGFNIHPDWGVNLSEIAGISTFGTGNDVGYVIFVGTGPYAQYAFTRDGKYATPT